MIPTIWELSAQDGEEVFKALASGLRLRILKLLSEKEMNINELGQALQANLPTVSKHVQALENAGLIVSEYMAGTQGTQKRCRLKHQRLVVAFDADRTPADQVEEFVMPLGQYSLVNPISPCGLLSSTGYIGLVDEPQAFLYPNRHEAQMLWMSGGFVEYVIPNELPTSVDIWKLEVQMEVCSECPDFNNDFPSDITLWVNSVEVGTWTSPGDFGGKRGRLNPPWWNDHGTQYGSLKVFSVTTDGSYVDGIPISTATVRDAMVQAHQPITVRIGVKPDARHQGGFNLFGRCFGNYQQDLLIRMHYVPKADLRGERITGHDQQLIEASPLRGASLFEQRTSTKSDNHAV